jgi:mannose-6-phosphate isomerase
LRGRPGEQIGESWEFSTIPGKESRVLGSRIDELLGGPLPFLAKLLDTARYLSIQLHPEDDPATGRLGKEEAWVILDAEPDSHLLVGVRPGIDPEAFAGIVRRAVADPSTQDALLNSLEKVPAVPGSCVLVPAGTVHAIGPGILLAEIQQPVDCTYRLFDYGSDREIHVEQALEALRIESQASVWRPGDPTHAVVGKHLQIDVIEEGTRDLAEGPVPSLVVTAREKVSLAGETLAPGDLRLCLGGPAPLVLGGDGLAFVGRCDP